MPAPLTDRRSAMTLTAGAALLPLIGIDTASAATKTQPASWPMRDIPFNAGWRFHHGAGNGLEQPGLDDGGWRPIDLPHDWSIEDIPGGHAPDQIGPFDKNAVGGTATGFTVGGEGWYRKHFRVDGYPADARLEVLFDGVYLESDVFLNGRPLGENRHGYIPFSFDLTPFLNRAGDNVLAVRVRNEGRNSRWYSGSGIYRPVTLDVMPADSHLDRWGVAAWTRQLENGTAVVEVTTDLVTPLEGLELVTRLRDADGKVAAETRSAASQSVSQILSLRGPRLWSPDDPQVYSLETELRRGKTVLDKVVQAFGVRIITFDPQRGMVINGKVTKLRGGCIHHDNGLLGACAFADADERRIRLLKARGFNAVRSSHNPSSRSLRDACDRLGMLLIEEAFDVWHEHKELQDFSIHFRDRWEKVIDAMVRPARNNPSVIMWSIGNEIPLRATDQGVEWEWKLANAVKRLDPTRPVTAGLNGVLGQEMIAGPETARPGFANKIDNASTIFIDVPGYNYRLDDIEREHLQHPERVVYASETFAREVFDYAALTDRAPYFLGEFVWTAMDYIGEAGLGATAFLKNGSPPFAITGWPWVNAWCGDLDLIGEQKAASLARDVAWGLSPLELLVQRPAPEGTFPWVANWGWPDELQSWAWPESADKPLTVRLYTSAERVELLLNGATVGQKTLTPEDKMKAEFAVPYAPGVLEAVAWKGDRAIARRRLETVGAANSLRLSVESSSELRGNEALAYVRVDVLDSAGRVLPDDQRAVGLAIEGPARLAAFGSANPLATGSLQSTETQTFRGRALAILRATGPGQVRVTAQSEGLPNAAVTFALA
ncbi:beta-galactosidase [Novosphingobium endophyticum]|uniref:Beta-galactosidase n=1 Tax=Novosphingobium endophyticum TaxID=1955250 RepID=A0A916TND0_9SPHN|nr:glycoside hydrolase family 2 TIM barrel-domain containing protein [Novosphingobium endophyticum]GGB85854.1 beta-galactosidase [Novosphingobium endophyticum]